MERLGSVVTSTVQHECGLQWGSGRIPLLPSPAACLDPGLRVSRDSLRRGNLSSPSCSPRYVCEANRSNLFFIVDCLTTEERTQHTETTVMCISAQPHVRERDLWVLTHRLCCERTSMDCVCAWVCVHVCTCVQSHRKSNIYCEDIYTHACASAHTHTDIDILETEP